jgi:uncharacterized protein (DUF1330 family)
MKTPKPKFITEHAGRVMVDGEWVAEKELSDYQFQVLDNVERLPGTYMYKDGELVSYDGSDVSQVVVLERWTLRKCKEAGMLTSE